jgi:hypothetical protein
MPFISPFDPDTPTDASPVAEGDNEIRSVKVGVIERMNTIVEDFENGTDVDGEIVLKLKDSVFPVIPKVFYSGTLAARPNPPESDDLLYFAEDTDQFFYSKPAVGDTFEWEEAKKADEQVELASLAVSAGESRFILTETDTRATRVKNAINTVKLSSSEVKVIYIPKTLWGYVADVDYDSGMYDPTILLVREGSMVSWYDPVAYGADVTGTVNSRSAILACYDHASETAIGIKMVAFTVPGTYLMTTDTDQQDVPLFMGAGTSITGGGNLTGNRPFRIPADAIPSDTSYFIYSAGASAGSRVTTAAVIRRIHMRVSGTSTGTNLAISLATEPQFTAYPLSKLHTLIASQHHRPGVTGGDTGGNGFGVTIDASTNTITFDNLASGEVVEFDLVMTFTA